MTLTNLSTDLLELLFDRMPMGLAIFDKDLRLVRCNPTWAGFIQRYTLTTAEQVVPGKKFFELAPSTEEYFESVFQKVLSGETIRETALESISDGIVSYWDVVLTPLFEDGEIVGFLDVSTDVTEHTNMVLNLEQRVTERTNALRTLLQVARNVGSTLSLEELLEVMITELKQVIAYDGIVIYTIENGDLVVRAVGGLLAEVIALNDRFSTKNALDTLLFETPEPIKITNVTSDHPDAIAYRDRVRNPHPLIRSWLGVPLRSQEKVIGELILVHHTVGYYDRLKTDYVQAFANQAAVAMENARLYQAEQERRQESERRRRVAEGLRDILSALNSNKALEDILKLICDQVQQMMSADIAIRYLVGKDDKLRTIASSRISPDLIDLLNEYNRLRPNSELQKLLASGEVVRQMDYPGMWEEMQRKPCGEPPVLLEITKLIARDYNCGLVVPILVQGEFFGSLRFFYPDVQEFDEELCELTKMIAEQTALAIENARLRAELQNVAVLDERNRLARELHDSVTQTLFSASLIAEVLPRLWEFKPEEGEKRLNELRTLTRGALAEMRTLLMELRPTAILEAEPSDLLRHLVDAFSGRTGIHVEFRKDIDNQITMTGDSKMLVYRVAQESLNNISKHAHAHQVNLQMRVKSQRVELLVQDDGVGFEQKKVSGDHFGLGIMRERAEQLGAKVIITSQVGAGTLVHLVIPTDPIRNES